MPLIANKSSRLFVIPLTLLFLSGCSGNTPNRGAISGAVTLDGKPVEQGSILFTPMQGTRGAAAGAEIKNGRYQLPAAIGPAVGWSRVEIRSMRKTGRMVPKAFGAPGQMVEEKAEAVAPKFNANSELKVEVKPGDNTADFQVTSK